ncbi:MAG TPA: 16S rRNA (uracil(1498)-N(3))-methyltransferase [Eubacteriaceae bacterium]|nr:16S rRNA (uracil(1498)-N(3))-methyltransferase [Eubacteriaceae bacterium]
MARFFVDSNQIDRANGTINILGEDVKHIKKVLRLKIGQELEICDGLGTDYNVNISEIGNDNIKTNIKNYYPSKGESNIEVTLYQGLPKSTKMDMIIQKCTELGIYSIVPIYTKRTIVNIENTKKEIKKIERWQRIAFEAAKQSQRGKIPKIEKVRDFREIWEDLKKNDLNLIAYEKENTKGLKEILIDNNISKVGILIGPEGGFDEGEIIQAQERGVTSFTLGPRILRTETAGFTSLAIIMYVLGDLGGY